MNQIAQLFIRGFELVVGEVEHLQVDAVGQHTRRQRLYSVVSKRGFLQGCTGSLEEEGVVRNSCDVTVQNVDNLPLFDRELLAIHGRPDDDVRQNQLLHFDTVLDLLLQHRGSDWLRFLQCCYASRRSFRGHASSTHFY